MIKLTALVNNNPVDAIEMKLPVQSYSVPEVVSSSCEVASSIEEKIFLPKSIDKSLGEVKLDLYQSLLTDNILSLAYLEEYPYECNEQLSSRLLPLIYINRIVKKLDIKDNQYVNNKHLNQLINNAIITLIKRQHSNGGWGWWQEDDTDPYLTAYVYSALAEAKKDQFKIDRNVLSAAEENLLSLLSANDNNISLN